MCSAEATPRTVAITGSGSGLGREVALKLDGRGYGVFGTGLKPQEVDDLTEASMLSSNSDSASAPEDFAGKTQQEEGAKYT